MSETAEQKFVEVYVAFFQTSAGLFEATYFRTKPNLPNAYLVKIPVPPELWAAPSLPGTVVVNGVANA